LKAFFGTTFKIKPVSPSTSSSADGDETEAQGKEREREEYVLSCVGTGFVNTARRAG
jgi:RNA 3'-terminal phosphate cyclase-like protein